MSAPLASIALGLLAASAVSTWIYVGYLGHSLTWLWSFAAADGWCDPQVDGVGVHCFGDYAFPMLLVSEGAPWNNSFGGAHSYTPVGMLPFVIMSGLESLFATRRQTLLIYLIVLAAALLVPAWWASRKIVRNNRQLPGVSSMRMLLFVLFGVATQPFLMTLDRGNTVGFAVPFLMAFAVYFRKEPSWVAPLAVILAAAVKPQYALISIAFLASRQFVSLLAAGIGSIVISVVGFLFWPGDSRGHFLAWADNVVSYQDYANLLDSRLANMSFASTLARLSSFLSVREDTVGRVSERALELIITQASLPGILLLVVLAALFVLAPNRLDPMFVIAASLALPALFPSVSFGYYSVFALVLASLVFSESDLDVTHPSIFIRQSFRWALTVAIAVTLYPVPIVTNLDSNGLILRAVGSVWAVVILWGIACSIVPRRWTRTPVAAA